MDERLFPQVACIQFPVNPGKVDENVRTMLSLVEQRPPKPNTLMVLPELWATGFSYDREETLNLAGAVDDVMAVLADAGKRFDLYFAGSLPEIAGHVIHNTLFFTGPEGVIGRVPKQHLFTFWREDTVYEAGRDCAPVQTPYGPVGGQICYDLRFPEVSREQAFAGAGLMVVSALWPKARGEHWTALLRARAVENQVYIAAANSCGFSGEMETAGNSMIIAPDGTLLARAGNEPCLISQALDHRLLKNLRRRFCPPGERPWRNSDAGKLLSLPVLKERLFAIRKQGSKVAFTNGCFDLLHAGHVSYLEHARRTADCLVLGLNSDASVRRLKGETRPVNSEKDRARVLAALGCVDFVVIFEEDTPLKLITELTPDVLVKGADWPEDQIVGAAEVKAGGGRVERIVFEHDRSTTGIIGKIQQQPEDGE